MRSSLRSSAEDSTPRETNPHDRISTSGQDTHKTKSKKNKKTKTTLSFENLDVDPLHDEALRGLDLSLLRVQGKINDTPSTKFTDGIQKPKKNKNKKNKSKNKISDTPTSTFENLDVDPRHDPSHTILTSPTSVPPTFIRLNHVP